MLRLLPDTSRLITRSIFRSCCRMSEPPKKKKKTILDFYGTGKINSSFKKSQEETGKKSSYIMSNVDVDLTDDKNMNKSSSSSIPAKDKAGSTFNNSFSVWDKSAKDLNHTDLGATAGPSKTDTVQYDMSPDLFTDSERSDSQEMSSSQDIEKKIPSKKPSQRKNGCVWKGTPLNKLNKIPDCLERFPPLTSTESHTVLFKTPYKYNSTNPPFPFPSQYKERWDADHVRMPCSNLNEYPVKGKDGKTTVRRRWEMIEEKLLADIPGPFELEEAILTYNARYADKWNFRTLHHFFIDELTMEERNHFFEKTLKKMAELALRLPHLCTQPVPLLKRGRTKSVTFSQQQIACLLANAFFCTFPRRNAKSRTSEFSNYPTINFNSLFDGHPSHIKLEKLKCIIHYFTRITKKMPTGIVTFTRQTKDKFPEWNNIETTLSRLHISAEGTIEDDGLGLLQVDFANRFLGGGVMGHGCVQEEIRFLICPEMLISRLITECLEQHECLIMKGCERFSNYDGYANTFKWSGDYVDTTPRDSFGHICTEVVAIDALVIHDYGRQFRKDLVKRELNKAFCGFSSATKNPLHLSAVCTGNWGCGAFGGDKRLKALIQLMAASQAKRDTCYFTFDDQILRDDVYKIHHYLTETNPLGIGTILKLIQQYEKNIVKKLFRKPKLTLFEYIIKVFDGSLENTDDDDDDDDDNEERDGGRSQEAEYWNDNDNNDWKTADMIKKEQHGDSKISPNSSSVKRQDSVDYKADTP